MKSFKGPKTQNEVKNDDKLMWESFAGGAGVEMVKENDEDTGRIPHDVDSFGTDDSTDSHLQWNLAQDKWHETLAALEPLDRLAAEYGGEDINPTGGVVSGGNIIDWLAKEINRPGSNFVDYFEQQLMQEQ